KRSLARPWYRGGAPVSSEAIAAAVTLGSIVRAAKVEAPRAARREIVPRSNSAAASARRPSRTTTMTRDTPTGETGVVRFVVGRSGDSEGGASTRQAAFAEQSRPSVSRRRDGGVESQ